MKSGNRTVSISLLVFVALCAAKAGREGETGTDAAWIAAELVRVPGLPAQTCAQSGAVRARQIVFETLDPGTDDGEARLLGLSGREVVSFEWNPATSELRYSTTAPTTVFSDLAPSSATSEDSHPYCE